MQGALEYGCQLRSGQTPKFVKGPKVLLAGTWMKVTGAVLSESRERVAVQLNHTQQAVVLFVEEVFVLKAQIVWTFYVFQICHRSQRYLARRLLPGGAQAG